MPASRAVPLIALVSAVFAGAAAAATPALVVDVDNGKVLYADHATDPWFPASIAKLMTTYVALDMVRSGRAHLDQLITISPTAAAQPPSRMGFPPGAQLTLENALKIIMVKSANDVAAAIAENLGGSIEGFASLMNDATARLGMRESHWINPHGLPGNGQQTSARDMAILGRALLLEFPDHKDLFSIGAIRFGDQIVANHAQAASMWWRVPPAAADTSSRSSWAHPARGSARSRRRTCSNVGSPRFPNGTASRLRSRAVAAWRTCRPRIGSGRRTCAP